MFSLRAHANIVQPMVSDFTADVDHDLRILIPIYAAPLDLQLVSKREQLVPRVRTERDESINISLAVTRRSRCWVCRALAIGVTRKSVNGSGNGSQVRDVAAEKCQTKKSKGDGLEHDGLLSRSFVFTER